MAGKTPAQVPLRQTRGRVRKGTAFDPSSNSDLRRKNLALAAEIVRLTGQLERKDQRVQKLKGRLTSIASEATQAANKTNDTERELIALSAQRRIAPVRERRAIARLSEAGATQVAIAERAGVSQAHVSRVLALVKEHPESIDVAAREVGWLYAIGEIGVDAMLAQLSDWPFTFGQAHGDSWERGTGDDVMLLLTDGFITEKHFEIIAEAVKAGGRHA